MNVVYLGLGPLGFGHGVGPDRVAPTAGAAVGGVAVAAVVGLPAAVVELPAAVVLVDEVLTFFELLELVTMARTTARTTATMTTGITRVRRRRRFCACCSSAMRA